MSQLELRAGVVTRSRIVVAITAALWLAPLLAFLRSADLGMSTLTMGWAAGIAFFAWQKSGERSTPARVRVDEQGLWIDDTCVAERGSVRDAIVTRREPKPRVRVRARRRTWKLAMQNEADAIAIVSAIGGDARSGFRRFVLPSWRWSSPFAMYVAYTVAIALASVLAGIAAEMAQHTVAGAVAAAIAALAAFALPAVLELSTRDVVTIGTDGVSVGSRFVPWSDVRGIRPATAEVHTVDLDLRDGSRVRLYTMPERSKSTTGRDAVLEALTSAFEAHARGGADRAAVATQLARGQRSAREWVAALRELRALGRGYRDIALDAADLFAVLTDAREDEEQRAAAAIALAAADEPEVRDKLRVALDDIAAPRVRVALEASLESNDDALVAALDEMNDQRSR